MTVFCAGKWMYTHTTRNYEDDQWVETRTNVSRQIYEQLLVQVKLLGVILTIPHSPDAGQQTEQCHHP